MVTDARGNLLACKVFSADTGEREALKGTLTVELCEEHSSWRYLIVDASFSGAAFEEWTWKERGLETVVVHRAPEWEAQNAADESLVGFAPLKWRWIVERTFAWFTRFRRLAKDVEFLTETSETMLEIAMCHILMRRLRPPC